MPVSGNEETGLKPVARMSSNYTAGIPIKKRRFPLIRPPSPAPEEQSSLPVGNESLQKEDSCPSEGSAFSSASVPASSALSDANKDSLREEIKGNSDATNVKMVHSNADNSRVKVEEPSLSMHPLPMAGIGSKQRLVSADNSANATIISAKTEVNLSPSETPVLSIGKDISSKQKVEEKSKLELSKCSGITELSLGITGHLLSAMPGQNGEVSYHNQERGRPLSLIFSSSKGEGSNQCKGHDFDKNSDDANRPTNRSNWDLNTTMDAWDGQKVDEASGQATMGGFNTIGGTHDIKPLISAVGMGGDGVTSQIRKENESRSNVAVQPDLSGWRCNSNDNLHLGLSPSGLFSDIIQKPSGSSASNVNQKPSNSSASSGNQKPSGSSAPLNPSSNDSTSNMANMSVPKTFVLTGNLDKVNIRTVKSEPHDESIKHELKSASANPKELPDFRAVKAELLERCNREALKPSTFSTLKLVGPRSIKSEPAHEGIQEAFNKIEGTLNDSDKMMLHDHDIGGETASSVDLSGKTTRSVDLSTSGNVSNSFEHSLSSKSSHLSGVVPQEKSESVRLIATNIMSTSAPHDGDEVNVSGMVDTAIAEDKNVEDAEQPRLEFVNGAPPDSMGNGEDSASDDEKINLSGDMLEEDSYGTDYESDGNHDLGTAVDAEHEGMGEEDFEDGEVREPPADNRMEEAVLEKEEVQPFNNGGDSDREQMDFVGFACDGHPTSSYVENKDTQTEGPIEPNNNNIKKFDETHDEKFDKVADDKDTILQELLAVEMSTSGAASCPKGKKIEQSSDEAPGASQGNSETVVQGSDEDVKNTDVCDKNIPALPMAESSFNVDDTARDANSGGHKSRIINLRASISSSPGKTRTIPVRSLPTRAARLPDVALEEDKLSSRGRDEICTEGSRKFSRDRHQDQSSGNVRLNFGCGRGRISSRIDTVHGDWGPERDFVPEFYNGPVDFRVPRPKYGSENDLEFNSFNVGFNGAFAGNGRGRRKPMSDEAPAFRHPPSRRRSPGGREGPPGRGHEMARRIPRNISPGRCIGEDGSGLVGMRHGDKFMRGLPNDNSRPLYAHPQASYEGLDGQFVRGSRNFLPVQRRGLPRIRSKSPIGSRRRSPDGFGGHPELPNRRSPPIYGMERMRSSDHSCFPAEMVVRRHGSSYLSRQDMDSGRNLGHPSPIMPNRSPSGRVLFRNTRRLDMIDPRERTDNDDYFGRPMHSGRYQELGADGPSEERRRFTDRQGPVRPFRPHYNSVEGEDFHLNAENGPRPFRFCPENDSEFHDRGNLREREFDRRIKNRPGNAPRRTRNIEEQEGSYRHGGHVWHDDAFDDMSRIKRKRF